AGQTRPVVLESRDVFTFQESRDLAGSADDPPVDRHAAPRSSLVPGGEAARELVADRLVVGRDDDQRVVRRHREGARRAQRERQRDDGRQQEKDQEPFRHARALSCTVPGYSTSTTTSSGSALAYTSPRVDC